MTSSRHRQLITSIYCHNRAENYVRDLCSKIVVMNYRGYVVHLSPLQPLIPAPLPSAVAVLGQCLNSIRSSSQRWNWLYTQDSSTLRAMTFAKYRHIFVSLISVLGHLINLTVSIVGLGSSGNERVLGLIAPGSQSMSNNYSTISTDCQHETMTGFRFAISLSWNCIHVAYDRASASSLGAPVPWSFLMPWLAQLHL